MCESDAARDCGLSYWTVTLSAPSPRSVPCHSAHAPFVTFSKMPPESLSGSEPSPVVVLLAAVSVASVVVGEEDTSYGENWYQSKFDTQLCPDGAWKTKVAAEAFSRASGSVTVARTVV